MNFAGESIVTLASSAAEIAVLQAEIDVIEADIITINNDLVTINNDITDIESDITVLQNDPNFTTRKAKMWVNTSSQPGYTQTQWVGVDKTGVTTWLYVNGIGEVAAPDQRQFYATHSDLSQQGVSGIHYDIPFGAGIINIIAKFDYSVLLSVLGVLDVAILDLGFIIHVIDGDAPFETFVSVASKGLTFTDSRFELHGELPTTVDVTGDNATQVRFRPAFQLTSASVAALTLATYSETNWPRNQFSIRIV